MLLALVVLQTAAPTVDSATAIAKRVEIVRTEHGVPHIYAEDLKAMGFALGWVQSEDYGDQVAVGLVKQRGTYARYVGHDSIDDDFAARAEHQRAGETFYLLDRTTQDVYEGFAEGLNYYIRLHRDEFPSWIQPDFTAVDAHAADIQSWSRADAASFARGEERRRAQRAMDGGGPDPFPATDDHAALPRSWTAALRAEAAFDATRDGSNAWALDGSRTPTGKAILLRNPHLAWDAGYYEAHVSVPGVVDFYGDFRIGGAFGIIGGFNRHLGWATTNNSPRYSQVYGLERHPQLTDHATLDGAPVPIVPRTMAVDYTQPDGASGVETEVTPWTPYGPVIYETEDHVYVLKDPRDGEFRRGEQFLRMMMATDLRAWEEVMRTRAHPSSNFTYADADGNIVLYYNARIPALPHEPTGDTAALATSVRDMWTELAPWESLPFYLNPPGGYVQQANDTPDYINLNVPLGRDTVPRNLPEPRLRLRSQLSFALIHNDRVLSLEDVIELKHSPRMLAAERMLDDLLAAVDATDQAEGLTRAREVLGAWDRTAAATSRGGVLFTRWYQAYVEVADTARYREPWDPERPTSTPAGLGSPGKAVAALRFAVEDMEREGIALDVPWGDVHRVIRGEVDEPVSGCEGGLGCFRTLSFEETGDGRLAANRGDGWILAVEFGDTPRAYSVLAYGQSRLGSSPYHDDQAAMFARGEMKPVRWTEADVEANAIRRYRPGDEVAR
jgi:acyl-homoserine-lactone acylase